MKKRIKRIISIILCIALVMSIENMSAYRDILVKIGSNVVTWAASKNENDKSVKKSKKESDTEDNSDASGEVVTDMPETTQDEYIAPDKEMSPEELASADAKAESERIEMEESEKASETQETVKNKKKKNKNSDETENIEDVTQETAESTSEEPETEQETESDTEYVQDSVSDADELAGAPGTSDWVQVSEATEFVQGQTYSIKSMDDWKRLIEVSQTNTLEGVSFVIYKRDATYDNWNLDAASLGTSKTIGNVSYPFSGTIYSFYATTVIYTDRVLFDYLSSKAHIGVKNETGIKTFVISYSKAVPCALAKNLVLAKEGCNVNIGGNGISNYYFEISSGTISANSVVGGLFAKMYVEDGAAARDENGDSIYKVNVAGPGIDLIKYDKSGKLHGITDGTVTGTTAGGIIGEISGDIDIEISGMTTMPVKVLANVNNATGIAGGFAGKVGNGVKIKFTNDAQINISTNVMRYNTSTGWYSGGFIGYMDGSELECASTGGVLRSGNTDALRYAGGLVGYANNSSVTVSNYTQSNDTYIYQSQGGSAVNNFAVGGVIGMYINDDSIAGRKLELSYIKSEDKNAAKASNIRISGANTNASKRGGLIGIVDAGSASVNIHDINTDAVDSTAGNGGENCYYVNMVQRDNNTSTNAANTETGGIAGVLAGTDISLENIKLNFVFVTSTTSNAICGQTAGGIAARVGNYNNTAKDTKMLVKDITVLKNYVSYVNRDAGNYYGGLFGVVSKGIVALQGTIDVSKVPYKTWANSDHYNDTGVDGVMLGGYARRGFVAGYTNQSIIYQDTGCVYTRPITYDADGNIEQFDANIIQYNNPYNKNTNTTNLYCIDDIGNEGSVLKNVESVLDITKPYSEVAQGRVDKDTDGYYVIDSLGDALRLAVAGNSVNTAGYPQAGGNCFLEEGETTPLSLAEIFSRKFRITTDLNLGDAGIHGFVNNIDCRYEFTGIFEGVKIDGKNPVITLDFISRQKYGGLFTNVKNATFKNIDIGGNLWYLQATNIGAGSINSSYNTQAAAGSISAYASGNIAIDNVNISTSIKTMSSYYTTWDNGQMWSYGGMFGIYNQGTGHYTCTDSKIAPVFTSVITSTFVGGMIGWQYVTKATASENMTISGCTVSTKLTSNSLYGWASGNTVHGRSGGLIALISGVYNNVGTTGNTIYYPSSIGNETRVKMSLKDTTVDDADIDLSTTSSGINVLTVGGALGYSWAYMDADIDNLKVQNTDIKSRGIIGGLISTAAGRFNFDNINIKSLNMETLTSNDTYCGFLIGNGRNAIVNINADNYKIAQDGSVSVKNYKAFDEIVGLNLRLNSSNGNEYPFSKNSAVDTTYINGGIVNITDDKFGDFTKEADYKSYVNQVVDIGNAYTRYYYNLFSGNEDDWKVSVDNAGTATIDSEKRLMAYTVLKYANANVSRFLTPYTSNIQSASIKTINVTTDIDLNTYSYYPVSISNTTCNFNGHKVRFYSEDIYNREKKLAETALGKIDRNNENTGGQHYLMHASLFLNTGSGVNINNIRLQGTVANLGKNSGALVAYSMTGASNVTNVELAGIKIRGYEAGKSTSGLMIAKIGTNSYGTDVTSEVTIDGITTIYDYTDTGVSYPVASALIGYVGSDSATNVRVTFRNLKLEDEKITGSDKGKVFEYASCVYDYRFTTDLVKNYCNMLYTFTKADTVNGNVTYGKEIQNGVEYLDQARDADLILRIAEAAAGKYIPYVYAQRNIYVNPRNGDLTRGCGTYEDPYIIDNTKQFITLYLYLTNKSQYDTMFKGSGKENEEGGRWKVNLVGGDDGNKSACSNPTAGGHHTAVSYGNEGFPTREDLSTAYYKIIADINLSAFTDMNDINVSGEYCGLGSEAYPFAGVIIGTEGASGRHTITLPKQGSIGNEQYKQSDFGLIWYMGGAVVKDLEIVGYGYNDTKNAYYNVLESGGGVASKIVGGDNIIDNVKVYMNFNMDNSHKKYGYNKSNINAYYDIGIKGIGGLVGTIDTGTLVLRNYQKTDETMINCKFEEFKKNTDNSETGTYTGDYGELAGILVGRVYDGNVIYEGYDKGTQTTEPYVLNSDNFDVSGGKYTKTYPLVNGFHVINANVFNDNKLTYSYTDATEKNYQVSIGSSEQLEMLAMAMNSDAMSVLYSTIPSYTGNVTGYSYYNRCRKADYNNVGATDSVTSDDRNLAYKYDDNKATDYTGYLYPYLCSKYIDYTGIAGTTDADWRINNYNGYKKTLSSVTLTYVVTGDKTNTPVNETAIVGNTNKMVPQVADYETTYVLQKDGSGNPQTFDVSGFDISFRGIGEVYTDMYTGDKANAYLPSIGGASFIGFSDFRANFDGNGNTVKFYINRTFDEDGIWYSGLFNRLTYNQQVVDTNASSEPLEIKNFDIKNSVVYNPNSFKRIEDAYESNGNTKWNCIYNLYATYVTNTCSSGLLTGVMQGAWNVSDVDIIKDKEISYANISYDVSGYKNVGGLIGRINNTHYSSSNADNNTSWRNSLETWFNTNETSSNNINISDCDITALNNCIFKVTELGSKRATVYCNNNTSGYYYYNCTFVGGMIGSIGTNTAKLLTNNVMMYGNIAVNNCNMENVSVTALNRGNIGGMAGSIGTRMCREDINYAANASIGNVTVTGTGTNGTSIKNVSVNSHNNIAANSGDGYSSGGMFGFVEAPAFNTHGGKVSITGYNIENINVDTTRSTIMTVVSNMQGAGGVIGYSRCNNLDLTNINITGHNQVGYSGLGKYVGGMIGQIQATGNQNWYNLYRGVSTINIFGCNIENMDVVGKMGYAGGIVGLDRTERLNIGSDTQSNTIKNVNVSNVDSNSAGGVVGAVYFYTATTFAEQQTVNINNMSIVDTSVSSEKSSAGGVIGVLTQLDNNTTYAKINMSNVYLYSTDSGTSKIEAAGSAGGLCGSLTMQYTQFTLTGNIGIGTKYTTDSWDTSENTGVNIKAQNAGGLIGNRQLRYAENHTADIVVANNRIYSYINNGNQQAYTYSGGLYGIIEQDASDANVVFDKILVKNNIIFTGRSNATTVNRGNGEVGCGGVFGYVKINNSAKNAGIYLPYLTLENNSIGYYAVSTALAKQNDWSSVVLNSKDIKLYDATQANLRTVSWDEIADLKDSNIGNYTIAFGQFIGRHSQNLRSSAVYILSPTVKVDKDKVGSIPVIDVGVNTYAGTADQSSTTYQFGAPYLYRNFVHIVYMDEVNSKYSDISTEDASRKPTSIESSLLVTDKNQYHFGNFESDIKAYQNLNDGVTDTKDKNYNYIMSKRLNMYMPYNDETTNYSICTGDNSYYNLTYNVKNEDGSDGANILNGVPVLILDGLDPQTVGDYAAAVLTNGGGMMSPADIKDLNNANCKGVNDFWQITAENAYIDALGNIKAITSGDSRFSGHQKTSIQVSNTNRIKLATSIYDEIIKDDTDTLYTITLLKYTYVCKGSNGDRTEVLYIPVFVKEKVTLDNYIRILSDEEYSLARAQKEGYKNDVTISHDSVYTIYTEFVYDAIRLKNSFKADKVNKSIIFDTNGSTVSVMSEGTKFTLIDYYTGVSYYYVSTGDELHNEIMFTDFKDKDGNPYETRNIGDDISGKMASNSYKSIGYKNEDTYYNGNVTYTDVDNKNGIGVERFFIVVEPPENANTAVVQLKMGMYAEDAAGNAVDEFFNKNKNGDTAIDVTYVPGPMIQFGGINDDGTGTDGKTYISGIISTDGKVNVDANVEIALKEFGSPYWDEKNVGNTIDSSNTNKYLEVAVTLVDENNNVVAWPAGTNISVNGGANQLLKNNLVVYSYKDMEKQFPMNNVSQNISDTCYYYNINESDTNPDWQWVYVDDDGKYYYFSGFDKVSGKWITQELAVTTLNPQYIDISNQLHMSFDFSSADIDEYSGNSYKVMLKLYRSDSPDYPNEGNTKAYGSTKRQYTGNVSAESIRELAVAVDPDELTDLGVNLYNSSNKTYEIPFTNRFDFSDLIHKNRIDQTAEECANNDYMVTYRIYKKVTADNQGDTTLPIGYNENIGSIKNRFGSTRYELLDWDKSPFTLYDADGNKLDLKTITVNDNEKQSVIVTTKSFTKDEILNGTSGTKYVTDWNMNLKIDSEKCKNEDLTNYMVTVSYLPYEKGKEMPQTDQAQTLFDYFIFTVAKLKTDM